VRLAVVLPDLHPHAFPRGEFCTISFGYILTIFDRSPWYMLGNAPHAGDPCLPRRAGWFGRSVGSDGNDSLSGLDVVAVLLMWV
jgi:hypothetical protein